MLRPFAIATVFVSLAGGAHAASFEVLRRPVVPMPVQYYEPGLPPWEAETITRSLGFAPVHPPIRSGDVWIVRSRDAYGTPLRVLIDAYDGQVLEVRATGPTPVYADDDKRPPRNKINKNKPKKKPSKPTPTAKPAMPVEVAPKPPVQPAAPAMPPMPSPPSAGNTPVEKSAETLGSMPPPVEPAKPDLSMPAATASPAPAIGAPSGDIGPRVVPVPSDGAKSK